jgi:hypothetical protein
MLPDQEILSGNERPSTNEAIEIIHRKMQDCLHSQNSEDLIGEEGRPNQWTSVNRAGRTTMVRVDYLDDLLPTVPETRPPNMSRQEYSWLRAMNQLGLDNDNPEAEDIRNLVNGRPAFRGQRNCAFLTETNDYTRYNIVENVYDSNEKRWRVAVVGIDLDYTNFKPGPSSKFRQLMIELVSDYPLEGGSRLDMSSLGVLR